MSNIIPIIIDDLEKRNYNNISLKWITVEGIEPYWEIIAYRDGLKIKIYDHDRDDYDIPETEHRFDLYYSLWTDDIRNCFSDEECGTYDDLIEFLTDSYDDMFIDSICNYIKDELAYTPSEKEYQEKKRKLLQAVGEVFSEEQ